MKPTHFATVSLDATIIRNRRRAGQEVLREHPGTLPKRVGQPGAHLDNCTELTAHGWDRSFICILNLKIRFFYSSFQILPPTMKKEEGSGGKDGFNDAEHTHHRVPIHQCL
jgi:hypothetical protein